MLFDDSADTGDSNELQGVGLVPVHHFLRFGRSIGEVSMWLCLLPASVAYFPTREDYVKTSPCFLLFESSFLFQDISAKPSASGSSGRRRAPARAAASDIWLRAAANQTGAAALVSKGKGCPLFFLSL